MNETILVVDDEILPRTFARDALQQFPPAAHVAHDPVLSEPPLVVVAGILTPTIPPSVGPRTGCCIRAVRFQGRQMLCS